MNLKSIGLGLSLSFVLLNGCSIQGPDQLSYKTYLAEKEKAMTGLEESTLPDNPYADKVENQNKKRIVYFLAPSNANEKVKKLSQKELVKLSKEQNKEKKPIVDDLVIPTNSTNIVYMGTIDDAVKLTQAREKAEAKIPNMKINPSDDKEKGITIGELTQQLNDERAAYGLPTIE